MIIRRGTEHDVLKVSRLWLKMVEELAPDFTPNVVWFRNHAHKFLKTGDYAIFVAEEGGKIVGFIDFFIFPEPSTGKIHGVGQHFYVSPEYRGNCISGQLYKKTVDTMKKVGCQALELFCMDNEKRIWTKKGYKPVRTMVRRYINV
jgi:GNAT superfamily N-acetyltransferase